MKKIFLLLCVMAVMSAGAVVKPGVEVLRDGGFAELQGKRVGLVTNPSGIDNNLKSTVDILNEAIGVKLVALFGPEHGVRGNAHAGDAVGDAVDPLTGIKMYSLFGKTHEPTEEMLKDIDVLVYDIQDVGAAVTPSMPRWACACRHVPNMTPSLWCWTVPILWAVTR